MPKSRHNAFTLLEVMVAVVIISIVIASLLQMMGNSVNIFSKVKNDSKIGQYGSFLIASKNYGFEDKRTSIYRFSDSFDLDSSLRSRLKNNKVKVVYTEVETIDLSEFGNEEDDDTEQEDVSSTLVFEIGKSTLKFKDSSTSLLRLRLQ